MKFEKVAERLYSKLEVEEADGKLIYKKKMQVYPVVNRDGSLNWFNLVTGGSWFRFITTNLLIFSIVMAIVEYCLHMNNFSEFLQIINNDTYCRYIIQNNLPHISLENITL